jgi:hypothetical protein
MEGGSAMDALKLGGTVLIAVGAISLLCKRKCRT